MSLIRCACALLVTPILSPPTQFQDTAMPTDVDLLTSLSDEELDALATSTLVPASQDRLDELLAKNAENEL